MKTVIWFYADTYVHGLEEAIRCALAPLLIDRNHNFWDFDFRRQARCTRFNFTREEHAAAKLWIKQAFGNDVKVEQER
jgi:hypothetical protein